MSTRRTFLQSALFLPSVLSAHAFAQDTNTLSPAPFADFENGWGDWTLEGDAFGSAPATHAIFPGKIRGFGGRGFLCTLHPRKGNTATGKAISREFTIEKPLITFKIGGGNFPGQACMNLMVDGQTVRTATGNGTPSLSDASWDVSALVGKKAHLEIVDSTASENRVYILVDDIVFGKNHNLPYQKAVTAMTEQWIVKYGVPGVWLGYIKQGSVAACVATGVKNLGTGVPASIQDHLNIGSVTKPITGSLIAYFVSKGIISYETTVGEVVPDLKARFPDSPLARATLRQLLTHTAGLPRDVTWFITDKVGGPLWRYRSLIETFKLKDVEEPGQQVKYSNLGLILAVALVEQKTVSKLGPDSTFENWISSAPGSAIGLSTPKLLDWSVEPKIDDVYPHIVENGMTRRNTFRNRNSWKYATSGNLSLTLANLCSFAQFTIRNTAGLPGEIFNALHARAFPKLLSDTSASWHLAKSGFVYHEGNTSRGEVAYMRIDARSGDGFVLYTNVAPPDGEKFDAWTEMLKDCNTLFNLR